MKVLTDKQEARRIRAIQYLAKANPDRYLARYCQGRLELFENICYGMSGWFKDAKMWLPRKS